MVSKRVVREGFIAGLLGAGAVAAWFFAVDVLAGEPLQTPRALGNAVLAVLGADQPANAAVPVLLYTIIHVAAFVGIGLLVAKIVQLSDRSPAVMAGVFLVFAVLQVGFYMLSALLSNVDGIGSIAWYQVLLANLVASASMGWYLWHAHPEVLPRMDAALKGTTP
jgi:hypothetical protein